MCPELGMEGPSLEKKGIRGELLVLHNSGTGFGVLSQGTEGEGTAPNGPGEVQVGHQQEFLLRDCSGRFGISISSSGDLSQLGICAPGSSGIAELRDSHFAKKRKALGQNQATNLCHSSASRFQFLL